MQPRPPVFVLAHEELQQSASESLGRDEVEGFLGQLHEWADLYRQRGWPPETPEIVYHALRIFRRHQDDDSKRAGGGWIDNAWC